MGLSMYNFKNWIRMLTGRSILHVNQGAGKIYSTLDVEGYYNDLTEKVTKDKINYRGVKIPLFKIENGSEVIIPIEVFQYGLGAYDLYLLEKKELFLEKFKLCVDWAFQNQEDNGAWSNFFFEQPEAPYSSMAQGEGASLLIRAFKEFNDEKYLLEAKKAIYFLVAPIENGGTAKYILKEVYLQEFTNKSTVFNGWIFSLFGLYDYLKVVNDEKIRDIYDRSVKTMISHMKDFDNGYWSKYNNEDMISSPFYHRLHIAQLDVLYELTSEKIFKYYSDKWKAYESKFINRKRAFLFKVYQKLKEK